MLLALALPIILSGVALFFASFLSWMVLQLHKKDWVKLEKEDEFMVATGNCNIPVGSYIFPAANSPAEMQTETFKATVHPGSNKLGQG
jgi:hypothetical protein